MFVNEPICCRQEELRKRASILLGIRMDDRTYAILEQNLKQIAKHKDLVSDFQSVLISTF